MSNADVTYKRLKLDDQLCFALYAATNAVTRAYRPKLDRLGLTYPQYLVLLVLWQDGAHTIRRIADRLRLPANAITPLIDRLEQAGFVTRGRDAGDRRLVHVHLTQDGRGLEAAVSRAQQDVVCETGLAPQDLEVLRHSLHVLVATMEDAGTVPVESR